MFNRLSKVKGAKKLVNRNQLLISSGLPCLDAIIGGGLPVGSIFLVEEDEFGVFNYTLLKHYLAEGHVSEHDSLVASLDTNLENLEIDLPAPLIYENNTWDGKRRSDGQLRIAWRYENAPLDETTDKPTAPVFGNTYNLATRLYLWRNQESVMKNWSDSSAYEDGERSYDSLYNYIKKELENQKYSFNAPSENRTVLRIALITLGTGSWTGNLCTFLIKLRYLLRNVCATCFISIQPKMLENTKSVSRCEHLCDTVIQMKSLLNDGNLAYEDCDGLLIFKKLPSVNNWAPVIPETNDWSFKLRKKRFIVEKLRISPGLKENDQRGNEEDTSRKILSCVSQQF